MKQSNSDTYNLAWFKIAECVARGEKERALGVYRLLSHSFNDQAFALQLEGDILLAFNESNAQEKYKAAAEKYAQDGRILQSAAIYEHLLTLNPDSVNYRRQMVDYYQKLAMKKRVVEHQKQLFESLVKAGKADEAAKIALLLQDHPNELESAQRYQALACAFLTHGVVQKDVALLHAKKAIDLLKQLSEHTDDIDQFLAKLKTLNESVYDAARALVAE